MVFFRVYLLVLLLVLSAYTLVVLSDYGPNLFAVFFGDMMALGWPGQFNLDFMMMLSLSALWVAWRHSFSVNGLLLSVLAFFGGAMFLTVFLSVLCVQHKGDVKAMLLGAR